MSSVAKQKSAEQRPGFFPELFKVALYKPNQGRIVRQVSFLMFALLGLLSAWELQRSTVLSWMGSSSYLVMVALGAVLTWIAYRLVNYSVFADFLISVEAEMNKVSWPSRTELWRASVVVMFVIFALAAALFFFDAAWTFLFELIGIRYSGGDSLAWRLLEWIGLR